MSVQDLNQVHRRYIKISNGFKSAWTFHQFVQGLRKVFASVKTPDYPADFQSVYNELKSVSDNLSEAATEQAAAQLDRVERDLAPIVQNLLQIDEQLSPGLLRQFFQRVKNYDEKILTQLVKFYLYCKDDGDWHFDRLDKADFLSTKLAEEYNDSRGTFMLRDRTTLREIAQGFWAALGAVPISDVDAEDFCHEIKTLEKEIVATESVDELHGNRLIQRYRDLKHDLGDTFFQPRVWRAILETNLAMKNHVHQLYRRDEQRIVAEYQQVFELEREVPVDVQLGEELSDFRRAVERFEDQLQGENVRLGELAELREKVRELVPKLTPEDATAGEPVVPPLEVREMEEKAETRAARPADEGAEDEERYVAKQYEAIVGALDNTNPTLDPKRVALQPEVYELGLSAREITAYRRLYSGATCDRELEQFVLRAGALRVRVEEEVQAIKSILDDTAVTRDAPVYAQARVTVKLADQVLRRYGHRIEQAVLNEDGQDAKALQLLKIRMMRAYAGLWLMIYRN